MNWIERLNDLKLQITTGDGAVYEPLWRARASKEIVYNAKIYDFVGVENSYVDRRLKKSDKYEIVMTFQGADCIEQGNEFLQSAKNPLPWTISHPIYDDIIVQPLYLRVENTQLNTTVIVGEIVETIDTKFPDQTQDAKREVLALKADIDIINIEAFTDVIQTQDIQSAIKGVQVVETAYKDFDTQDFTNLVRSANNAAQKIASDSTEYINRVIDLINYPYKLQQDIEFRIDAIIEAFENLKSITTTLFEHNGNALISAACAAAVTATSYVTRKDVYSVADKITAIYEDYIETLETADDYLQDEKLILQLDIIVSAAVGELYEIALQAKQERQLYLQQDTNIINLVHELYKYTEQDLSRLIKQNNLAQDELILIPKGKLITFYS